MLTKRAAAVQNPHPRIFLRCPTRAYKPPIWLFWPASMKAAGLQHRNLAPGSAAATAILLACRRRNAAPVKPRTTS